MKHAMPAVEAVAILDHLAAHGVDVCVGGGWAVDALLGEQTRDHSDLDLWAPADQLHQLFLALEAAGVDRILPWPGDRPWNFVLHDGATRRVDLHLYEPEPGGDLHYGSAIDGTAFPAAALRGHGVIAGRPVTCEAPEWAFRWHTGYPPRDVDFHDVRKLGNFFGFDLPSGWGGGAEGGGAQRSGSAERRGGTRTGEG